MPLRSIACAAACSYAVGGAWYSPYLFGDAWLKATKKDPKDMENHACPMVIAAVADLGLACALDHALPKLDLGDNWRTVAMVAGGFSLINLALNAPHYAFERQNHCLIGINVGYNTVRLALMTAVMLALDRND